MNDSLGRQTVRIMRWFLKILGCLLSTVTLAFPEYAVWDRAEGVVSVRAVRPQRELVVGGSGRDQGRGGAAHLQTALPQRQPAGAAADAAGQASWHTGEIRGHACVCFLTIYVLVLSRSMPSVPFPSAFPHIFPSPSLYCLCVLAALCDTV